MAISRSQLVKELEPGLNALFGMEYDRYEGEHAEIFDSSDLGMLPQNPKVLASSSTMPMKHTLLVTHTRQLRLHSR